MTPHCPANRHSRGLTLFELICLLAVLLIGLSFVRAGAGLLHDKVATSRLDTDIRSLNYSIYLYRASGGSLEGVETPFDVIARIQAAKSSRLTHTVNTVVTGLNPILQNSQEARTNAKRAIWNPVSEQFEISRDGSVGIKGFGTSQPH